MSTPEQSQPPVYACAAGAVLHEHAEGTLEPAVLLYTFLPPGVEDQLRSAPVRVDVHADAPGSSTVTVRVLTAQHALSWQLPLAPLVAGLPGQPGDEGRMVLLGLVDAEPDPGFWARPVDCERLAAELQLPVVDLVDSLRGRLTPWLAQDVDILLHDDAHEHAADQSPEQTLAVAVLQHYRGELDAEQSATRLVRGLEFGSPEFQDELGRQLATALWTAVQVAGDDAVEAALAATGPFEGEVLRLLQQLPGALRGTDSTSGPSRAAEVLVEGPDRDEAVRAAVSVVARLARRTLGADLPDAAVLERLGMVDDAGLAGLAGLWVALAALAGGPPVRDEAALPAVAAQVVAGGIPAAAWLAGTSAALAELAEGLPGRRTTRVARALDDLRAHEAPWQPGVPGDPAQVEAALRACLELARAVRSRTGLGPSAWLRVRAVAAAQAVVGQLDGALDRDTAVDLLADLLEQDVEGPDLLDALVCATSQVLLQVDPSELPEVRQAQVDELLQQVPAGPRAARWVLAACLREAHGHDSSAPDLAPFLAAEPSPDLDRAAARTGVRGLLEAGIVSLQTLVRVLGPELGLPAEHALALVLPAALVEHDLLRLPDEQA